MHSSAIRQPPSESVGKGSARGNAADACRSKSRVSCSSRIHAPNGGSLTHQAPSGGLPDTSAYGRGASLRPKSTASGRATRRASSDPACILPQFASHLRNRSGRARARECGRCVQIEEPCKLHFSHPRPQRGLPHVDGPLGGAFLIPRPLAVVGYSSVPGHAILKGQFCPVHPSARDRPWCGLGTGILRGKRDFRSRPVNARGDRRFATVLGHEGIRKK